MTQREELEGRADWQQVLYRRYHQKVFAICLYFLKDREEAKDASHDVFLKVFRAWQDFEWKCDPMTWIGAIAKHDCFSRLNTIKRRMDQRQQLAHVAEMDQLPENQGDLLLHRLQLEKHMPHVRGRLKEILRLNMEGLNHREIAARMGVSRVAVTRHFSRFKKTLLASVTDEAVRRKSLLVAPRRGQSAAAAAGTSQFAAKPSRAHRDAAWQESGIRLRAA